MSKYNQHRIISLVWITLLLVSCDYFQPRKSKKVLAKVGQYTLHLEDLSIENKDFNSTEDSLAFLQIEIQKWALEKLIYNKAKFNLPIEQQKEFDAMAERYRVELYSKAYKDALIEKRISSTFSEEEIEDYYENHKQNFRLNEVLLQLRYLHINPNLKDIDEIKTHFKSYNLENQEILEGRKLEYRNYLFNDTLWLRANEVFKDLPLVGSAISKEEFYNRKEYFELSDSTSLYLIKINKVLLPLEIAPLNYIKPTIEQILTNRRKFEAQKETEKEILKDGIKNNEFEIYP